MKKIIILFALSLLAFTCVEAQGYNDYKRAIENLGLIPYRIPDKNYCPVSVLKIMPQGFLGWGTPVEMLQISKKRAFPNLTYMPNSGLNYNFSKVKTTTISLGAKANTSSLIPAKLLLSLNFDYSNIKSVTLTMTNPTIQEVSQDDINSGILSIQDTIILNELIEPHVIVVAKALRTTGYTYSFKRNVILTAKTADTVNAKIDTIGLGISVSIPQDSSSYTMTSTDTLYFGYRPGLLDKTSILNHKMDIIDLQKIQIAKNALLAQAAQLEINISNTNIDQLQKHKSELQVITNNQKTSGTKIASIGANALTGVQSEALLATVSSYNNNIKQLSELQSQEDNYNASKNQIGILSKKIQTLQQQQDAIQAKKYSFVSFPKSTDEMEDLYKNQ